MFINQRKGSLTQQSKATKDLVRMVAASSFLLEERRQALLQKIQELSALEASRYESLCALLIENLVAYCQNLPETANSYYSQPGGLVDHALNRTEAALSLFQEFMIHDQSEALSEEQKLWQYALFSAAILQGIGKLFVDFSIRLFDSNGQLLQNWNPLLESLVNTGSFYDYEFLQEPDIEFRRRLNLLLARTLIPASGFAWIASNTQVLAVWLALLNEDSRGAGTLGAILVRADALAIQRYFNEYMAKLNQNRSSSYGRSGTFSGGVPVSITEKELAVGIEFIQWLNKALAEGRIMVNRAPLFMVPGGMLMSQELFQLFVKENPEYKNWQAVRKGFLALGLHSKSVSGGLTSRFEQPQTQHMESGVVFLGYAAALPSSLSAYYATTGKTQTISAIDLVHKAQYGSQFIQQHSTPKVPPLQKLATSGLWMNIEAEALSSIIGAKNRV